MLRLSQEYERPELPRIPSMEKVIEFWKTQQVSGSMSTVVKQGPDGNWVAWDATYGLLFEDALVQIANDKVLDLIQALVEAQRVIDRGDVNLETDGWISFFLTRGEIDFLRGIGGDAVGALETPKEALGTVYWWLRDA